MQQRALSLKPQRFRPGTLAAVATLVTVLAGCTTSVPAPVVDRTARPVTPPPITRPATPTPANPAIAGNTAGSQFHVVQKGETLYSIARSNNIDVNALSAWNNVGPGQVVREGQVLRLAPPTTGAPVTVSPGTVVTPIPATGAIQGQPLPAGTPLPPSGVSPGAAQPAAGAISVLPIEAPLKREPKSQRVPYSDAALIAMQQGDTPAAATTVGATPATAGRGTTPSTAPVAGSTTPTAPTTPASAPTASPASSAVVDADVKPGNGVERDGIAWTWPTSGKVASKFNDKAPMKGIDIAASAGTPVVAAASGKVIYVGKEPRGYGQMIVVSHAKETVSVYFHTDKVQVKEQQRVLLGAKLAEVSDAAANKLHFEVRRQGRPIDPVSLMPR